MIKLSGVSPERRAYQNAAIMAAQPWMTVGILIWASTLMIKALTLIPRAPHWAFPVVMLVGICIQIYGLIRQVQWRKAHPFNDFTQGAQV
jgi:hypothetical protein